MAVFSTVGKIRKALELAGARRGIVSRVDYMSQVFNWLKMALPENLHRPYLFKDSSLLLANPIATSDSNGVLINIDAKTIIENSRGFKLSPESCQRQNEPALNSSLLNC